ncbi:MAG: OPT/YSL family transporter, partial [Candidatus Poseidoniaceae archaeon]|nr:OPT/YSL family transporter [Candidatus Poseidoniaceae archaeon]
LNLQMVLLGAVIAVILVRLKMPVMSVAIGIYLPLYLSVPIIGGGIISHVLLSGARLRIDGTLEGEPSPEAKNAVQEVQDRGVLIGAGFIAGESLMGVLLAIFIVAGLDPSKLVGGTLGSTMSLLFFGWFVAVFIVLASRALPRKGNLLNDFINVLSDALTRLKGVFTPPRT